MLCQSFYALSILAPTRGASLDLLKVRTNLVHGMGTSRPFGDHDHASSASVGVTDGDVKEIQIERREKRRRAFDPSGASDYRCSARIFS